MYFPYLRAVRHELAAVKALLPVLTAHNNTLPILEPVKQKLVDLTNTLDHIENAQSDVKVILIVNPAIGEKPLMSDLIALANARQSKVIPAFIVGNRHNRATATDFAALVAVDHVALIHERDDAAAVADRVTIMAAKNIIWDVCVNRLSAAYSSSLSANRVYVEDAFNRQQRNADYPDDDFFSDIQSRISPEGYTHFGDYTIMPKEYRDGGGPAIAVALHMLYQTAPIWRMKHFVSDPALEPDPVAVKYDDARRKLLGFVATDPLAYNSMGAQLFAANPNFPGLGKAKEYSIMHHVELRNM